MRLRLRQHKGVTAKEGPRRGVDRNFLKTSEEEDEEVVEASEEAIKKISTTIAAILGCGVSLSIYSATSPICLVACAKFSERE